MKSFLVKLMLVGLLAAGLLTFCPQVLPLVKPVFTPAATHPPAPVVPLPGVNYLAKVENLRVYPLDTRIFMCYLIPIKQGEEP